MKDKPRAQALSVLRFCEQGFFADELLYEARRKFDRQDNAFITEIVYGVLRNRSLLDLSLDQLSMQPVSKTDAWTRNILRMGAYQLLFLDKVPPSAAVNTSTELAKHYGKKPAFVNALLRNIERRKSEFAQPQIGDPVALISVLFSHPEWLVRRWVSRFGIEKTEHILRENNRPAPLTLRTNTLKTTREDLAASLEADGARVRKTFFSPVGLEITSSSGLFSLSAYREGWFMVQDEAAQLVGYLLDPKPGEIVLDACAAPGGKAAHLAELMKNSGEIIALENDPKRISRISENAGRLGITIIRPVLADAATYCERMFNKILIDAPCSGLGVLRRHPDGRWLKTERSIKEKQTLQRKILKNCSELLKPGGAMVYATCTTEPEENEEVILEFLAEHTELSLDDLRRYLPSASHKLIDASGFFRTFPAAPDHNMDGFFGARIIRKI